MDAGLNPAATLEGAGLGVPRRAENFSLAWLCGPRRRRERLALYRFCRLVDDIGDEHAGDRMASLDRVEDEVHAAARGAARHPVFTALTPLLRSGRLGTDPFLRLVEANRQDQRVRSYATWADLDAYCSLSAAPVGEMVLALEGVASPDRIDLSAHACAGLQLANHWQDLAEDARRGRCYVPQEVLRRHGVSVASLARETAEPGFSGMLDECLGAARHRLGAGWPLVARVHGRLRAEIAGFVACGAAACDSVAAAGAAGLHRRPGVSAGARLRAAATGLRALGLPGAPPAALRR